MLGGSAWTLRGCAVEAGEGKACVCQCTVCLLRMLVSSVGLQNTFSLFVLVYTILAWGSVWLWGMGGGGRGVKMLLLLDCTELPLFLLKAAATVSSFLPEFEVQD